MRAESQRPESGSGELSAPSFSSAAGSSGSEWTECCGSGGGSGSGSAVEESLSMPHRIPATTRENAAVASIEETTRDGYPAVRLTSGDLAATFVPQLGMIGASLEHRGEELLGQRN